MTEHVEMEKIEATMADLLARGSKQVAAFLEELLPTLFTQWWEEAVLGSLSFQQRKRMDQQNQKSLRSLDLAALLRVLDHNWYQISSKLNLGREEHHFVKEMQTIRNRWAHPGAEGFPVEDVYRDLDTLERFVRVVRAEDDLVREVKAAKKALLMKETLPQSSSTNSGRGGIEVSGKGEMEFAVGTIVCLKSDPSKKGAVVGVLPGDLENRFNVFMDGSVQPFYASQLRSAEDAGDRVEHLSLEQFHAYLTALQIRHPGLSTLYSLNAARVDFIPYQFRPVLRFIRSDRPRLLIADGVGMGKTIEAGLILRELQARRDVRSVLIICPRPLVTEQKWMNEMKRFEERFTHLDGPTLRYCMNEMHLDGVWPHQHQKSIMPYSLFDEELLNGSGSKTRGKRKKGLLELDPPPRFDLVIVDEAHHIRNTNTYTHKAVRFFCDNAEAVVFLTATPIQMGDQDLFVLLNTLRPDLIIDPESYGHMAEPNPFINKAVSLVRSRETGWQAGTLEALDHAAATAWGQSILRHNPIFISTREKLAGDAVTSEECVQMITDLEAMHTFAGIINRTRRRDIGEFTVRRPETVAVEFTPAQRHLHDELMRIQAEIFRRIHGNVSVKFMMTTIRRQAASCLYGLAHLLRDILSRHVDDLTWDEADDSAEIPDGGAFDPIRPQIEELIKKAGSLDSHDPKLEALRSVIRNRQTRPNNKVMLFSSFRHTLKYLYEHLKEDGTRVGVVHGGTPDEERMELRKRFEKDREDGHCLDILLFSEIGCEGLDYQFCDCMVNYDLPWNPMRIEQRIGRIDRNGQKSESIAIINMVTPGTVDADIYMRCLLRIGVFNSSLGGSEEILGEVTREIRAIAENLALTEEEQKLKLQQLADNKIRLIQEQERLEQQQVELFGIRLPEGQMEKDIEDASSFGLSVKSLQRLVLLYLQQRLGREQEFILGEKPLKTLRLSEEARNCLLKDYRRLPRQNTPVCREWETWLKGGEQHLSITFDAAFAVENPKAAFITPLHPLVKQAALLKGTGPRAVTVLRVHEEAIPPGRYEFAIYQWHFHGIREDLILKPVASSPELLPHLVRLLERATDAANKEGATESSPSWEALDARHYTLWAEARDAHCRRTRELAEFRRESLTTSHRARMALLSEQLDQATNEKIQIMRQSQITTAEADYARHIQELDIAMERADLIAEPVAYGTIHITGESFDAK